MFKLGDNKVKILTIVLLGTFMTGLNNSLMNLALPYFANYFQRSFHDVQWIVNSFLLSTSITMIAINYLLQKIGEKKLLIIGQVLFLVGSVLSAISPSFELLVAFRVLQGIGSGVITPLSLVVICKYFDMEIRGTIMGIWGAFIMIAPMIGPIVAGTLLSFFNAYFLFLLNVPLSILCIFLIFFFMKDTEIFPEKEKLNFDWLGFFIISIGIIFVLLSLNFITEGGRQGIPMLLIGIVSLLVFVEEQKRARNPLVKISILKNKGFVNSLAVISLNTVTMYSILLLMPLKFQNGLGIDPFYSGLLLAPHGVMMGIFAFIGGKILDKKGPSIVIFLGAFLTGVSSLSFFFIDYGSNLFLVVIALTIHGIGSGFMSVPTTTAGLNSLEKEDVASGSAMNNLFRQFVKSFSVLVLSSFFVYGSYGNVAQTRVIVNILMVLGIVTIVSLFFIFHNRNVWDRKLEN